MPRALRFPATFILLCTFLFTSTRTAKADIGPTQGQVVLIFVAVAAIGAAIGVGVYYAVRKAPSLTGCTSSTVTGVTLLNEDNQQVYMLMGDTALLKTGEHVRVKGKKKKDSFGKPAFLVDKVAKDFGPCKVASATP